MGWLVMFRCARPAAHEPTPLEVPATLEPNPLGAGGSLRDRLRNCWLFLDWLQRNYDTSPAARVARSTPLVHHRAALDDLVATGELDAVVADYIDNAYSLALHHVHRSRPGLCYEAPVGLGLLHWESRGELVQQPELLAEMADSGELNPGTVAQAQAAIGLRVAFLNLSEAKAEALCHEGRACSLNGLEIPAEAAEAARYLVELLLEE